MRVITAILALLGTLWAILGLYGATVMLSYPPDTTPDAFHYSISVGLFTTGYFVWWGWVFYSFKKRFPLVPQKTFWIISLLHHIVCTFYITLSMDKAWVFLAWLIGNIIVAAIFLISRPWNLTPAVQAVAPNRSLSPTLKSTSSVRGSEDF